MMTNRYIDRSSEKQRIVRALEKNDIVVISGPAGIGKTTLALSLSKEMNWNAVYVNHYSEDIHSFDRYISSNNDSDEIYIYDDLDYRVNEYINFYENSRRHQRKKTKVILITRNQVSVNNIPVIRIQPLSTEEIHDYLKIYNLSNEEIKLVIDASKGNILLVSLFASALEKGFSIKQMIGAIAEEQNRLLLYEFALNKKSKEKTPNEARELFFQIVYFGPLSKNKLKKWNAEKDVDSLLDLLVKNFYISISINNVYATLKTMKFSEKEENDYSDHLLRVFLADSDDKVKNAQDEGKLVEVLKKINPYACYVSDYYEKKDKSHGLSDKNETNALLNQIIQEQLNQKEALEQINKTTQTIDRTTSRTEAKLDELIQSSLEEIEKLRQAAKGDEQTLLKIDELAQIIKNPKKSKKQVALDILGALGSIASIASILGVSNLPNYINLLFR